MTRTVVAVAGLLVLIPALSQAQPLGQFRWQLQPFCNVLTLNVTQTGAVYTLDGFDNQCGGNTPRAPLVGVATPDPDGSVGFGLNIVTTPNGTPVHVRASIQLATLSGTWTDSAGNVGTFVFNGSAAGSPRPAGGTLATLSVTGTGAFGGALSAASVSTPGNGSFGGVLSAGSVSSPGNGSFGGVLSAGSVAATGSGGFGGPLSAASVTATGAGTFGGAVSGASLAMTGGGTFGGGVQAAHVTASGTIAELQAEVASNTNQPNVVLSRARGTAAAPLPLTTGTSLGVIFFAGFDGTTSGANSSFIAANAAENWTTAAHGSRLNFHTVANGTTIPTQRMRITDAGFVGIGTSTPDQLLSVNGNASKVGGGTWATFSDERLKTIRGRFGRGLSDVLRLQPIRFEYTADNALGLRAAGEHVGFSAQAVRDVIPEAVSESTGGYLQINSDPILWTMLNALKDLKAENDAIAARNGELERRLAALEAAVRKQ